MVKFTRQFEGQLVPEWKHAFVDYSLLKKDLKRMEEQHGRHDPCSTAGLTDTHQQASCCDQQGSPPFHQWLLRKLPPCLFGAIAPGGDHGVIQVRRKLTGSGSRGGEDVYETELLDERFFFAGGGGDTAENAAAEFFVRLDAQLNKVNQFYTCKEKEFLERGESLRRQVDILADLKAATARENDPSVSGSEDESTRYVMTTAADQTEPIERETAPASGLTAPSLPPDDDRPDTTPRSLEGSGTFGAERRSSLGSSGCGRKSLKINIPLTNPSRTNSALTDVLWAGLVLGGQGSASKKCGGGPDGGGAGRRSVNKTKLRHAEKMIRGAFVELYKGLGYLATYRNLNMMAFVKILKKFEKVSGRQALNVYLKVVESSYFNSSDEALKLMDEVEDTFVRHFAGNNRCKAMKYLKPAARRRGDSHAVPFLTGLATGCFAALFAGYCVAAGAAGMYTAAAATTRRGDAVAYVETAYPVLSAFALLFLHLFMYGCNMAAWRRCRVNYGFIFELSPAGGDCELGPRDVFLMCAASMTSVAGVMLAHLALVLRGHRDVKAVPGILLLVFLLILFCPFNIVYRSSRFLFLRILRNIVLSPLYKVVMVDFFMADQLCSQVPMLRSLEFLACYYISGSYRTQDGYCVNTKHIRELAYAVSFLPYYWRAMQCARRWFDEGDTSHLVNLGKYVSAMLAAGAKVAYEKDKSVASLSLLVAVSSTATVYQLYWDFVEDWGLLQPKSKNPWLRNDLILKRKYVYYLSMGLNLVLRLAWLQTVIRPNFGNLDSWVTSFFLAALEVIRRGHWNFYRLENEHLNNAGRFRAVKTVPLPFHEVEDD